MISKIISACLARMLNYISKTILSLFIGYSIAQGMELADPFDPSLSSSGTLINSTEMTPLNLQEDSPVNSCGFLCGRLSCFYKGDEETHDSCSFSCMNGCGCGVGSSPHLAIVLFVGIIDLVMLPTHILGCTANFCATQIGDDDFSRGYQRGSTCYPKDTCSFTSLGDTLANGWDRLVGYCFSEERL